MRRRLTLVIVATVIGAVLVTGLGTLALTRITARHRNQDDLGDRAQALATLLSEVGPERAPIVARRRGPSLGLERLSVIPLGGDAVPSWLSPALEERLSNGATVTARRGDTAYAAAPLDSTATAPDGRAVVLADTIDTGLGAASRWFVVAGAATALAGVAVAAALARSLARPLAATEATAQRIARGDLGARVPVAHPGARSDELDRLADAINAMAASLQRARQAEQDFLLSVSHDLRTPLTSIGGWAEALADGAAPNTKAAGETIGTAAHRLDRLVNDLLDLARLRARAFALTLTPVDLRDAATDTAATLGPELADAGLAVLVAVPPEPVVVDGDADRLVQIATNLLDNARRHAAAAIRVTVVTDGGAATLAVEDDGPGIPPVDRQRVFERLHTSARPATRPGTGTGLGLAIVAELASAMGGRAEATEPTDGGGARLVVTLPLSGVAAHA
jgi:two-component system sensor histidine kinase BaeS